MSALLFRLASTIHRNGSSMTRAMPPNTDAMELARPAPITPKGWPVPRPMISTGARIGSTSRSVAITSRKQPSTSNSTLMASRNCPS